MKHRITATTIATLGLLATSAISQDNKEPLTKESAELRIDEDTAEKKAAPAPTKVEIPDSIKNLSPEQRARLQELLTDASNYIGGIRIQEAFEKIIEAEAIAPDLFQIHNLRGAAYTKIRDFDKARAAFQKALDTNPQAFMSRFNITELDFVEHKYADAEKNFRALINDTPQMTADTKRLVEFKILISQLKQGKKEEAMKIQNSFGLLDEENQEMHHFFEDTPAYFFGQAAFAFEDDNEEEARGWIRSAESIYPAQAISVYVDSFIETGWIENLQ